MSTNNWWKQMHMFFSLFYDSLTVSHIVEHFFLTHSICIFFLRFWLLSFHYSLLFYLKALIILLLSIIKIYFSHRNLKLRIYYLTMTITSANTNFMFNWICFLKILNQFSQTIYTFSVPSLLTKNSVDEKVMEV
jgi:hypothetical protein